MWVGGEVKVCVFLAFKIPILLPIRVLGRTFFLFLADSAAAYTRSATLKKALVLSLRAEYTRLRDKKTY